MDFQLEYGDATFKTRRDGNGTITVLTDESEPVSVSLERFEGGYRVNTGSGSVKAEAARDGDTIWVRFAGRTYRLERSRGRKRQQTQGGGNLSSPMPGQVQKLLASEGETVRAHQPLLVVEAMKMQLEIKAPHDGVLVRFLAAEGDQVEAGVPLAEMEASP